MAVSITNYLKQELPYNYPSVNSGWYQYITDYLPFLKARAERVTIFPDDMQQYKYRLYEYLKDKFRLDYDALLVVYLINKDLPYLYDFTHGVTQILLPDKESLKYVYNKYATLRSILDKEKITIDYVPF